MTARRYYHVVKLEGDADNQAVAAPTRQEAIELLHADPDVPAEDRRILSIRVRASDAGAARLMADAPWIWGMLLSAELSVT